MPINNTLSDDIDFKPLLSNEIRIKCCDGNLI
jgi:hypothetical protein